MLRIVRKILLLIRINLQVKQLLAVSIGIKGVPVSGCTYRARPGPQSILTEKLKRFDIGLFPPVVGTLSTAKLNQ